jgi:hypothetical protein
MNVGTAKEEAIIIILRREISLEELRSMLFLKGKRIRVVVELKWNIL